MASPRRGDVWLADLGQPKGHEQRGIRPVLIISEDALNRGASALVIALPLTSRIKNILSQITVTPPEGGLKNPSAIKCEAIQSISQDRLIELWGQVNQTTLASVEDALRLLLGL